MNNNSNKFNTERKLNSSDQFNKTFKSIKSKVTSYKNPNVLFILGTIIILAIVFIILFPEKLTSQNPYSIEGIKSAIQSNGTLAIKGAPFSPSKENLLGTDSLGRDILSIIVYGTSFTVEICFFVVLGRFLIALPLGIAAGVGNSFSNSAINLFNVIFSTVPSLLISIMILKIAFFTNLFKAQSLIAFVVVLTAVGWSKLAGIIRERVQSILAQPFVTGEKAIGKSNFKIIMENVLPHFSPELTVLFFMEMALALSMLMQLGFFGLYVGNIRVVQNSDSNALVNISYEPEWASMLSSSINSFKTAPWTVLSPAAAFFISIFGFNLFGEGLRKKLQSKNSMFIVNFRNILTLKLISKKTLKYAGSLAIIILALFTTFTVRSSNNKKAITAEASALTNWEGENQVLIGSNEASHTADYLKAVLEKTGFKPLGKDYIQAYNVGNLYSINSYKFKVTSSNTTETLALGKDFSLENCTNYFLSGNLVFSENLDIFNIKDFSRFDGSFVALDEKIYSKEAIKNFSEKLQKSSKSLGIIDIISDAEKLPEVTYGSASSSPFIYLTRTASLKLKKDSQITLDIKTTTLSDTGKNVIGVLPGNNPKTSKEAILISVGYNYLDYDKESALKRIKMAIELAYKLNNKDSKLQRTIIIAFWDGNKVDKYSGERYYCANPLYLLENTVLNLDLTNIDTKGDTLRFNTELAPVSRYFAWAFNHELQTNLKNHGIKISTAGNNVLTQNLDVNKDPQAVLYTKGVPTIIAMPSEAKSLTKKTTVNDNFVDILVNTITENKY
ncbi:ABC transporter permease subunit [Clostridium sp. YIM B02505]|uniref:ABC transporter permease subunit n=1 Tax=Clostridium yunnanense TaxID=2800325 RepID=A0ABS1ESM0_9CLOT|nr:ABC transporter permease subunit [Clostridium yunnanense]MBK1812324.1 ABC transporter permease subunit [Clostridium yunnanense]